MREKKSTIHTNTAKQPTGNKHNKTQHKRCTEGLWKKRKHGHTQGTAAITQTTSTYATQQWQNVI